jgi:hydrogenase maturation protease
VIRIIGVGGPLGDDRAGLEAARRLAAAPPPGCEIVAADRPGLGLIELLEGADAVIIIDAVRSGAPPGTLHDLDLSRLASGVSAAVSSHAFGVAAALQLAAQLGHRPAHGRVLGVEIAPGTACGGDTVSVATRGGIERAVRRVRQWVERLRRVATPADPAASRASGEPRARPRPADSRALSRRSRAEAPQIPHQ